MYERASITIVVILLLDILFIVHQDVDTVLSRVTGINSNWITQKRINGEQSEIVKGFYVGT